ncbi:hypothetical protein DFH09DRAFT_1211916, partial [Mycena vulgaris]
MPHRTQIPVDIEDALPQDPTVFEDDDTQAPAAPEHDPVVPAAAPAPAAAPPPAAAPLSAAAPLPAAAPAPAQPLPPPPPRRTGRVPKPSEAALRMMVSDQIEEQALISGEDWAHDRPHPTANAVDVDWADFDAELLTSPWAFASAIKGRCVSRKNGCRPCRKKLISLRNAASGSLSTSRLESVQLPV